jgi:hypothetical protein
MRRCAWACLLSLMGLAVLPPAAAQLAPDAQQSLKAPATAPDALAKKVPAAQPAAYEDRLIDDGTLRPDIWDDFAPLNNESGLPRGLRVDGLWFQSRRDGQSFTQGGVGLGAFLTTPQYGALSFDGIFTNGDNASVATFWQRDVPFDGGWRAANGLGMLNSPAIDLVRFQPRIFLSTAPMVGGVTEWRGPDRAHVIGGFGEPGVYVGAYVPEFRGLGGQLTNVGAQRAVDLNWNVGFQYAGANDVTSGLQPLTGAREFSTRSLYLGAARQDAQSRFQFNGIESQSSFGEARYGAWFDGYTQTGRLAQSFGLFWLDPNLAWGNQPVANNARGGYYRAFYGAQRWNWDAGVDYVAPLKSEGGTPTTFLNGSVRYQFFRDLGVGAGANVRYEDDTAWQGFAYVEQTWPLLVNRSQLNRAEQGERKETALTFNQTWNVPAGTRLNTTVGVGWYRFDTSNSGNQAQLAIYGGGDIARNLSLDLNLQWGRWYGEEQQPTSTTGSVVLGWSILPRLRLIATAYRSQSTLRLPLTISSPLDPVVPTGTRNFNDTGLFLTLRFETRAGSLAAPLGGMPGTGAGRVSGTVFLDANESGRLDAGEQGAANVTVILDGRYSARTDAQGRFEFPAVAAGRHVITVMPDNVPLPWMLSGDGRREVEVPVRGNVTVDIAAQRLR